MKTKRSGESDTKLEAQKLYKNKKDLEGFAIGVGEFTYDELIVRNLLNVLINHCKTVFTCFTKKTDIGYVEITKIV